MAVSYTHLDVYKRQDENVFIVNGDTFFDVDLAAMAQRHQATGAVLTVATKEMEHF